MVTTTDGLLKLELFIQKIPIVTNNTCFRHTCLININQKHQVYYNKIFIMSV